MRDDCAMLTFRLVLGLRPWSSAIFIRLQETCVVTHIVESVKMLLPMFHASLRGLSAVHGMLADS